MKIGILPEAKADLNEGYWFYENQAVGLGEYFLTSIASDIRSLQLFGGIHVKYEDKFRMLASRFPYSIFYRGAKDQFLLTPLSTIVATRIGSANG